MAGRDAKSLEWLRVPSSEPRRDNWRCNALPVDSQGPRAVLRAAESRVPRCRVPSIKSTQVWPLATALSPKCRTRMGMGRKDRKRPRRREEAQD
jgi:hypothetical protein